MPKNKSDFGRKMSINLHVSGQKYPMRSMDNMVGYTFGRAFTTQMLQSICNHLCLAVAKR